MSLAIAGMGWVTPLGNGVDAVWERLLRGDEASATSISEQFADRSYSAFRVPESAVTGLAHPRLRRASVISRFAATAGLEALQAAAVKVDSQNAERIAKSHWPDEGVDAPSQSPPIQVRGKRCRTDRQTAQKLVLRTPHRREADVPIPRRRHF